MPKKSSKEPKAQYKRNKVVAKTENQKLYIRSIKDNHVIICKGLAGTGKSHIAMGMAVHALVNGEVEKIIISRPVVESGENLGFLPGNIDEKLEPYLRPVMDELSYYANQREVVEWKNGGQLEICPLAFMRGRSFHNSFVICDECQNATWDQMEMLVSRLGTGSTMIITGDPSQSDLPKSSRGGFEGGYNSLEGLEGVGCVSLEAIDIVRNPLVGDILAALQKYKEKHRRHLTDVS